MRVFSPFVSLPGLRSEFPVLDTVAYLNAGTDGPLPAAAVRAASQELERELRDGRAMAHFDGRAPCSYLLDPKVNYVPELPLGGEDPLGRHALCFTGRHPDSGRRFELVSLPDGCAFDLLGISA